MSRPNVICRFGNFLLPRHRSCVSFQTKILYLSVLSIFNFFLVQPIRIQFRFPAMNGRVARDMFPFYRTCLPALLPLIYFPFFFLFEKKNSLQLAFRYASFLFSFKIRLSYLVTLFSLDTSPRKGERVGRRPPEKFPAFFSWNSRMHLFRRRLHGPPSTTIFYSQSR